MDRKHYEVFAGHLLNGDEDEAVAYASELLKNQTKLSLFEDIITPAMYHIGVLWEQNKITVADEHLATAVCDFVVSSLDASIYRNKIKAAKRKKVMLMGVEQEQHYIGLKMVASFYREQGWRVRYLGPNLPTDHALTQIREWEPDVIGISAALSYRLPLVKELIAAFRKLEWSPEIILGGRVTRIYDLSDLEDGNVHIVKELSDLKQLHIKKKAGVLDETS